MRWSRARGRGGDERRGARCVHIGSLGYTVYFIRARRFRTPWGDAASEHMVATLRPEILAAVPLKRFRIMNQALTHARPVMAHAHAC